MKRIILAGIIGVVLGLSGCATSTYSVGSDFNGEAVSTIHKGQTTTDDLVKAFGQPFSKTLISENQEKWTYMYSYAQTHAQSLVFSMQVQTVGTRKTLEVLIKNGVVENYTYSSTPLGNAINTVTN